MKSKQLLSIILVMAFLSCNQITSNEGASTISKLPIINSVVPIIQQALVQLFTVNAKKGGTIETKEGTLIKVPENCFVKKDGSVVEGDVTISFSQFDSPMEIIASGIPMAITIAGESKCFESAGMFKINGQAGKDTLLIAKDKQIGVELNTPFKDSDYSFYEFDENKGEWKTLLEAAELSKITVQPANSPASGIASSKTIEKPLKIESCSPNTPVFELNVTTENIEGLNGFDNIMWTYAGQGTDVFKEKDFFKTSWQSTTIQPSASVENAFDIKCVSGTKEVKSTVKPVLFGSQLKKAKREYDRLLAEYNKQQEERKKIIQNAEAESNVKRMLAVSNFGVFNCDRVWPQEVTKYSKKGMKPNFGPAGKKEVIRYYVVNPSINSSIYLYTTDEFKYRSDCENYLLAVLPENEIAVCNPQNFKSYLDNKNDNEINFTVSSKKITPNTQFTDLLLQ